MVCRIMAELKSRLEDYPTTMQILLLVFVAIIVGIAYLVKHKMHAPVTALWIGHP